MRVRMHFGDNENIALPPKLFQEQEERVVKMGSCSPRPACPTKCPCSCHHQRPGMVLVWVPQSSVPLGHSIEASDSSDDGGVFQRTLSINDDDTGGKWGPRILRNKMAAGASYPVRRRSQGYASRESEGGGDEKDRSSVILTSYKSTNDCSFNGDLNASPPEESDSIPVKNLRLKFDSSPETLKHADSPNIKVNGHVDSTLEDPPPSNKKSKNEPFPSQSDASSTNGSNYRDSSCPEDTVHACLDSRVNRKLDSAPALPQSEVPSLRNRKLKCDVSTEVPYACSYLNGETSEDLQANVLPQKNSNTKDTQTSASELPNTEAPPLKGSREDKPGDTYTKVRKPARRSKVPSQALSGSGDLPPAMPPRVPSKPPRGAAPPPPPFVRKGSLKSVGSVEEQNNKKGSSLPSDELYRSKSMTMESEDSNGGGDTHSLSQDSLDGSSVFRSPNIVSPKSIDWESHLRDEPLYQTYRQAVIRKEIRRQTVPRNSSFTSYDSSHDSPVSCNGSPKQGRRSTASHNSLWQELPAVKESGVLEGMTNEQRKMQESMFEVLTSEASYLRSLNVLTEHFLGSRELQEALIIRERKILFSNIVKVKEVSERFLMDLEARVDESIIISDVCDLIYHHALHHFSVYIDYVRNQLYQEKTYSELMEKSPQFYAAICRLQELPQCHRLPFMSFMLLPFQRITRIKMLIENILKRTDEGSESEQNATKALDAVEKIIQECNREVGRMKQTEELIHIAQKIEFDKIKAIPIISQTRFLEKRGELSEVQQKGSLFGIKPKLVPVYFFLFNDFLLITQRKSSDKHIVLDYAHRSLVQLQSCPTMENSFFLTLLENHQGKTCDRLFKAPTQSDLHRWVAAFPSQNDDDLSNTDTIYEDWDCPQVHCIDFYTAVQTDELSLEPADIINVLRKTSEGWYEGIRLCDGKKGWFPSRYVQEITNEHVRRRNLRERHRVLQAARHIQLCKPGEPRKKASSA
ncbi:rho guanine nucleotide exchange factor 19-like isoform 2-T2 [Discoglossus pictus]